MDIFMGLLVLTIMTFMGLSYYRFCKEISSRFLDQMKDDKNPLKEGGEDPNRKYRFIGNFVAAHRYSYKNIDEDYGENDWLDLQLVSEADQDLQIHAT